MQVPSQRVGTISRRNLLQRLIGVSLAAGALPLLAACGGTAAVTSNSAAQTSQAAFSATQTSSIAATSSARVVASSVAAAPTTSVTVSAAAPATPTAAAVQAGSKKVTLALWMIQLNPEQDKTFRAKVLDPFNKQDPNLQAELNYITWGNAQQKVLTAMAGNASPDIFQSAPQWTPLFIGAAGKENLLSLDPYLASFDGKNDFYPNVMNSVTMRGHVWGLPYGADTRAILYRKSAFTEASLDPEKPPTTWQELATMAVKTTKLTGSTFARAGYNVPIVLFTTGQQWTNFFYQQGGSYYNQDLTQVAWNSEAGIMAAQFQADLVNKYRTCPLGGIPAGQTPAQDPFMLGKIAISDSGSGTVLNFKQYAPTEVADLGFGWPLKEKQQVMFLGGNSLHISSETKTPQDAWTLLKDLVSPAAIEVYGEVTSTPTTRISVNQNAQYMKETPLLQKFAEAGQYGKTVPTVPGAGQTSTIIHTALESVIRGKATPKEALDAAVQQANAALAEARKTQS